MTNREIKFRAWDTVNRKMYVSELESIAFAKNGKPANVSISGFSKSLMVIGEVPQIILLQFTGLMDKNGKEIYEGDVVRYEDDTKIAVVEIHPIYGLVLRMDNKNPTPTYELHDVIHNAAFFAGFEVIGNIYENPELIQNHDE